ncbi:MAG: hypothetical protein NC093_00635, partial [Alistipes sp.]|nr:hypothetical protein [Alistipes sp.]
ICSTTKKELWKSQSSSLYLYYKINYLLIAVTTPQGTPAGNLFNHQRRASDNPRLFFVSLLQN